ncbi:MAG: Sulfate/thiosulfate import ATP-binding protein CysA [Syntrophorhabdus sp. PtaU1.Bin058]|nr:MAG: Sulfate/thiosulfate import ATP-binding protein CysA [Syntrophorhabdus sp. PtaU1.Bin058]
MELIVKIQKQLGTFFLDADFTIKGDQVGVFGPSGSGKSTLVSLIAGLRHPDRGLIGIDGETLFDSSRRLLVPPEHRRIGMVFQRPHLFPHLSVRSNLLYGYKRCDPQHRKITLDTLVEVMQIGPLLDRGVRHLSGGEKQRVAIGRAVLSNPRLLLMDEPLSAVDDNLKFQIISYLKNTCEIFKIPYLFISHALLEMRIMTNRVLTVEDGRVTGQVTAEDLARERMKDATGYTNLLRLTAPRRINNLYAYHWGDQELFVSGGSSLAETLFEVSSTDIILFKRHPEAISARNLLKGTVVDIFNTGTRIGVELKCGDGRLIAEIVKEAVDELELSKGVEIYAAIKAVAFRHLG